jgi:hypothetical protein
MHLCCIAWASESLNADFTQSSQWIHAIFARLVEDHFRADGEVIRPLFDKLSTTGSSGKAEWICRRQRHSFMGSSAIA